jgi:hypothetical protein
LDNLTKDKATYFYFVKNSNVIDDKYYTLHVAYDANYNKNLVDLLIVI